MMENTYYIPMIISAVAVGITYLISYCSVISPGNIEFNEYDEWEKRLIYGYNIWFDKIFKLYVVGILGMLVIAYIMSEAWIFLGIQVTQIIFLTICLVIMTGMYRRSKRYFAS